MNGIRQFSEEDLEALNIIECLKLTGLEIRDIRKFMEWCSQESSTYGQRLALFQKQKTVPEGETERMQQVLDMLKFKCWYYTEALEAGNEDNLREMTPDGFPKDIQKLYDHGHGKIPEESTPEEDSIQAEQAGEDSMQEGAPREGSLREHALREEVLQPAL